MPRRYLVAALGFVIAVLPAGVAQATFPGSNGPVAVVLSSPYKAVAFEGTLVELKGASSGFRFYCNWVGAAGQHHGDCYSTGDVATSPDGSSIAINTRDTPATFAPGGTDGPSLRILARDGVEVKRVALPVMPRDGYWFYRRVRWSPDGSRFLLARIAAGPSGPVPGGVLVVARDSGEAELIDPVATDPDWSVRGDIAYVRDADIYVQSPGAKPRRLTWRGATHPSWSPDGRSIAFSRGCGSRLRWTPVRRCGLYVVPTEGGKARLVIRRALEPAWSPDGRQIAFVRLTWKRTIFQPLVLTVDLRTHRIQYLMQRPPRDNHDDDTYSSPEWLPPRRQAERRDSSQHSLA